MTPIQPLMRTTRLLRLTCLVFAGLGLVLLPLAGTGCSRKAKGGEETEEKKDSVEVITVKPERMDLTREIDQPGYLQPYDQTPIFTKIAGFAKDWKVDKGSWVKKGDLMLELRVPEVVQDLRVKTAQVELAKANLKQSKEAAKAARAAKEASLADIDAKLASINSAVAQVMRWEAEERRGLRLKDKGIFDTQTYDEIVNQLRASEAIRDEAKAKFLTAKATYDQASAYYLKTEADVEVAAANQAVAEAARDQWADWLSYARITAPYDGIVTARNVSPEDFLQPATSGTTSKSAHPIFMLMRTDIMRCTVDVPELDALLIKPGDKAIVHFQARPGLDYEGDVTLTSEALDEKSRTLSVEIFLKNPDCKDPEKSLRPGMYANVTIMAKLRNALTLPSDAIMADILADGDRSYCYMVEGDKVQKTFLQIGARCDEGVQVLRKMNAKGKWVNFTGKEVVVTDPSKKEEGASSRLVGPKALRDGQKVEVKASEKSS